jgi:hypothetical protein
MAMPIEKTKPVTNYLEKSYLIYGLPKIGKTTLISNFGNETDEVLFFPTEDGHKELSIYSWKTKEGENPTEWKHFQECVAEMVGQTKFKILAIDTADNLFDWCSEYIIKKYNIKMKDNGNQTIDHEGDVDYGKIYSFIKKEMKKIITFLTQKGYSVIFISHLAQNEKTVNRRKVQYTDTSLPNTAKKVIHPLCYYIFYLHLDDHGNRWILTKGRDDTNAGDRSGKLPELIPLEPDGHSLKAALLAGNKPWIGKTKPNKKSKPELEATH